jgi:hypothetical protein
MVRATGGSFPQRHKAAKKNRLFGAAGAIRIVRTALRAKERLSFLAALRLCGKRF